MELREITAHHDGHGLNEALSIQADELGPGGASHYYNVAYEGTDRLHRVAEIQFQKGPRNVEGSTPGLTEASLLAVLQDRLECFQAGEYPCEENAEALEHIKAAMDAVKKRADKRAARGVLGTYAK